MRNRNFCRDKLNPCSFHIFFLCLSIIILIACSREYGSDEFYDVERRFTVSELEQDFHILRSALEEAHPGIYRYTTEEEFDNFFDVIESRIIGEMTEIEFFRFLSPIISKINCVHTHIHYSTEYADVIRDYCKYFPLDLKFIDDKVYIIGNYNDKINIMPGSELLAINDKVIKELVNMLFGMISSDGHIDSYKYRLLEREFAEMYFKYIEQPDSFQIRYTPHSETTVDKITLPATTLKSIWAARPSYEQRYRECLKFQIFEQSNLAVLTVKTFVPRIIKYFNFNYDQFIDSTFTEIKDRRLENLILDVRWNDGGQESLIYYLLSKFLPEPFQYYSRIETATTEYSFLKYTDKGFGFKFFNALNYRKDEFTGRYLLKGDWNQYIKPTEPHFDGHVYIIINGYAFSGAAEFASLAHYNDKNNKIKFIGEETGGAYYGNNSGDWIKLMLPNTKIRIDIPIRFYLLAVSHYAHKDRGLIPDYIIVPKIEQIINGIDSELDFTIKLIKQGISNESK